MTGIKPTDEPYHRPNSYQFFKHVKMGDKEKILEALEKDRFLVYTHNEMAQTPLIVASKRNLPKIAQLLLDHKADANHRD